MGKSELDTPQVEPMKLILTNSRFAAVTHSEHEASYPSFMPPGFVAPPPGLDDCESENVAPVVSNRVDRPLQKEYRHKQVPKNINLEVEYKYSGQAGPPTTLMIRNIPNRYSQHELVQELEALGFAATFDFFYMPVDHGRHRHHGVRKSTSNVGYAFVNFVLHIDAEACMDAMRDYVFKLYGHKVAVISVAHIQGLEANLAHYEKAAVNAPKCENGPLVLTNLSSTVTKQRSTISEVDLEDWAPAGLWATDWTWTWPATVDPWLAPSSVWEGSAIPGKFWHTAVGTWGHDSMPGAISSGAGKHLHVASGGQGKKTSVASRKMAAKQVAQIGGA